MKKENYYYVTSGIDEFHNICKEGLRASKDGYIDVITDKRVAGMFSEDHYKNFEDYAVIRIKPKGVVGVVENVNNKRLPFLYQRRIKQDLIGLEYLHTLNLYHGVNCPYDMKRKEFTCQE